MDLVYLKKLVRLVEHSKVDEIEVEEEGLRVRIAKNSQNNSVAVHTPSAPPQPIPPAAAPAAPHTEAKQEAKHHEIKSPIVGTFYGAPSPGAEAFVQVGDPVEVGQVLCIIEAMKLMNEIESDAAGEIIRIYVENGQPVEYGESLFALRTTRKK